MSTKDPSPSEHALPFGLERLIFFSDAVFAIAITLLAIDLRIPSSAAGGSEPLAVLLDRLSPRYTAYLISFFVIGVFWIGHHRMYGYIRRYDRALLWLNLIFLFLIAAIPFPTSILSYFPGDLLAVSLYAAGVMILSGVRSLVWWYASSRHRLIDPDLSPGLIRHEMITGLLSLVIFALSIPIAVFISPTLAMYFWAVLIPLSIFVRFHADV